GFADDLAPPGALVAVRAPGGEWAVGDSLAAARAASAKVQGRRTTAELSWPVALPAGDWDLTLRTTWVEPAYLEPDASWCAPGGEPMTVLANGGGVGGEVDSPAHATGGAGGGKRDAPAPAAARALADQYRRPVRVVFSREDVVRLGPKRPPIA